MQLRDPSRGRRTDAILCALFVVSLAAPTLDQMIRPAEARSLKVENRNAAPAPTLLPTIDSILEFPARFEAFHGDRLGLRDVLVRWHNAERMLGFGAEPTPAVVVGKDRWLFFTADQSVEIGRGLLPLSEGELETWRATLEERRRWLAKLGIEYQFVIVPNKESIYPERVPARLNRIGPTRLDQLMEHMRARSTFEPLDLRVAMRAEKEHDLPGDHVFFPLGTHWTERGAWAATNAILDRIRPAFPSLSRIERASYRRELLPGESYDSFGKVMRIDDLLPQACWLFVPIEGYRSHTVSSDVGEGAVGTVVDEVDDKALPRAMLVHDSFGPWVRPFLAQRCSRLTSIWQHAFPKELIWAEKPQVVIQMYTERALAWAVVPLTQEVETVERAAFERMETLLPPIDVAAGTGGIEPYLGTHVARADDPAPGAIAVETSAERGMVLFPEFKVPENACPVLHIDITSPGATALEVWYTTGEQRVYDRKNHLQAYLNGGRNDLYVKLPVKGIAGRLLVRPGLQPGRYLIHGLEARALRG